MVNLALALLLCLQEPSVAELLKRMESGDIEARDKSEVELIARGVPALAEAEAALAVTDSEEYRLRLKRVVRKLQLVRLFDTVPRQFSEAFQKAEPELLARLKTADPGAILDAIAATSGRAWHWETVDQQMSHGTMKVAREIVREPAKGVTRADAVETLYLALRSVPEDPDSRWQAVRNSARAAIKPQEAEDRRRLFPELLPQREDEWMRQVLNIMIGHSRDPEDAPTLLLALDTPDLKLQEAAARALSYANPGSQAAEFEKRLASFKPPLRRFLLYPLRASGDRKFLRTFESYLHSEEGDERIICFEALQKLAPESLPGHMLRWMKSGDPARIKRALQQTQGMPSQPPARLSEEMLAEVRRAYDTQGDDDLRALCLMFLHQGPPAEYRECVLRALTAPGPLLRTRGIYASKDMAGDDIREALQKLADGADEMVALDAASVLMSKPSPPGLDRVRAILKSKDVRARSRAMLILSQHLKEKAKDDLVPMLEDPKPEIQSTAIRLLAGTSGLEERFRRFLESPNEFVVDAAARALAQVGDKAALPVFRKRISSSRFHEFLPDFLAMAEPTWSTLLHGALFKIPDKGGTVADVVEGIRLAMKEKGCEVRFELGEEVLKNNIGFHYGISPNGWGLGWVRTMIPGSDYFFDGKVLFILPRAEAQKRWLEWAKTK